MEYLTNQQFVHRDLAARNCMLEFIEESDCFLVKIADFGLSRDIKAKNYYRTTNFYQRLPLKWMAPESIENGIYNTKTDVWSFGIVLWEIFSFGKEPYPDLKSCHVINKIKNEYRLPRPSYSPEKVHNLMCSCWSTQPDHRPDFTLLLVQLFEIMRELDQRSYANLFTNLF